MSPSVQISPPSPFKLDWGRKDSYFKIFPKSDAEMHTRSLSVQYSKLKSLTSNYEKQWEKDGGLISLKLSLSLMLL